MWGLTRVLESNMELPAWSLKTQSDRYRPPKRELRIIHLHNQDARDPPVALPLIVDELDHRGVRRR
jgi:hypothetical protein